MSINITPEIEAAYKAHLDEQVDADFTGKTIRRRDTYPYVGNPFSGLVSFAAGYQSARTAPTSAAGATKPNELTSSPEPAPALRAAEWVEQTMYLAEFYAQEVWLRLGRAKAAHAALRAHLSRASGLLPVAREGLTQEALLNACLSYRHDFGLMPESERAMLMFEAGEWARAFGLKVEPTTTDATRAVLRAHLSSVSPASGDAPGEAK